MKKFYLIATSLLASTIVIAAVLMVFAKPQEKTQKKAHRAEKISSRVKYGSMSIEALPPGESLPPISAKGKAIIESRVLAFPRTIDGSGPPDIWADADQPTDPVAAAIRPWQPILLKYPNGFVLNREYRHPDEPTLHNWKEQIEDQEKYNASFYGGVKWQLININGYEALARENVPDDGRKYAFPRGANVQWYVKPFLYVLWSPDDTPLKEVIPVVEKITEFANKNVPSDLPPYAANNPYGYDLPNTNQYGTDNPQPQSVSPPIDSGHPQSDGIYGLP